MREGRLIGPAKIYKKGMVKKHLRRNKVEEPRSLHETSLSVTKKKQTEDQHKSLYLPRTQE